MRVDLFTTTYNNESVIEKFINFYKERNSEIKIHVWDEDSTDKTVELATQLGCNVRRYKDFFTTKDLWKNECWKHIPSDCIIVCNINEFIDIIPNIFRNCSIVGTKGYDIASLEELNTQQRNTNFDKYCIFDPRVIKDMHFEGTSCNPQGFARVGELQPNLYHLTKLK